MSKAFTRESDDSDEAELRSLRPALPPGATNYITQEGARRLEAQLAELLEKKQHATTGAVEARAVPDLDLRKLESGIRQLQQILQSVVVAEPPLDKDKIGFGAVVTLRRSNSEEEVYRIVGVEEIDLEKNAISWISPLARALLTRRAGDKLRFRSPGGEEELSIISVSY